MSGTNKPLLAERSDAKLILDLSDLNATPDEIKLLLKDALGEFVSRRGGDNYTVSEYVRDRYPELNQKEFRAKMTQVMKRLDLAEEMKQKVSDLQPSQEENLPATVHDWFIRTLKGTYANLPGKWSLTSFIEGDWPEVQAERSDGLKVTIALSLNDANHKHEYLVGIDITINGKKFSEQGWNFMSLRRVSEHVNKLISKHENNK